MMPREKKAAIVIGAGVILWLLMRNRAASVQQAPSTQQPDIAALPNSQLSPEMYHVTQWSSSGIQPDGTVTPAPVDQSTTAVPTSSNSGTTSNTDTTSNTGTTSSLIPTGDTVAIAQPTIGSYLIGGSNAFTNVLLKPY